MSATLRARAQVRVGIFALQDIAPGEELTYDYQFQHAGLASDAGAYRHDVVLKRRHCGDYLVIKFSDRKGLSVMLAEKAVDRPLRL